MPEVASMGLTEEEARKENDNIKVSKFPFMANGKVLGMGETEGTLALSMEATAFEIVNTIHAHPTLAEAIAEAAEGIISKPIHLARG